MCIAAALIYASGAHMVVRAQSENTERKKLTQEAGKPELPFQIELLETHFRFEANGDSRKEVHAVVHINNLLGAQQFSRLAFDYDRAFQQVEIPLVRIRHANGGTSEILPSAVNDAPNPAVEQFPAYYDVRVKSVRILGLQEGDTIEYRVITTVSHAPLAPDFWLQHDFDRSRQVAKEIYEVELPTSRMDKTPGTNMQKPEPTPRLGSEETPDLKTNHLTLKYSGAIPAPYVEKRGDGDTGYTAFRWTVQDLGRESGGKTTATGASLGSDVEMSTLASWDVLSESVANIWEQQEEGLVPEASAKADELTREATDTDTKLRNLYEFVSSKIATVDLPLMSTGMAIRAPGAILSSGYGSALDKAALLIALAHAEQIELDGVLVPGDSNKAQSGTDHPLGPVYPGAFDHVLVSDDAVTPSIFLDPGMEVAPFGVVSADLRGKTALRIRPAVVLAPEFWDISRMWTVVPASLPFRAIQNVVVEASVNGEGALSAKVKYTMRGDNELLLRVAFHQSAKEKWKQVANLLALSDGFRGQVTNADASDPTATKEPFTVEYELKQPKFVDWSKKPVRIPALLPLIGLPDAPSDTPSVRKPDKIDLGTPLEVQTTLTLTLPPGTQVQTPVATTVSRDYATFTSKYSATQNVLTASRQISFLKREIPAEREPDYNAFVHAVQNDQAQFLVLENRK